MSVKYVCINAMPGIDDAVAYRRVAFQELAMYTLYHFTTRKGFEGITYDKFIKPGGNQGNGKKHVYVSGVLGPTLPATKDGREPVSLCIRLDPVLALTRSKCLTRS